MIYRCVNCGGNVIYEPKEGKMKCLSCGGDECQEMIPAQLPDTCVNCGMQIPFSQFASAGRCPACGTYLIRDNMVSYPYGPDIIIPFKISKQDAENLLKKEFGKKLFLPGSFLSEKTLESMRGVYVPFWMYDYNSDIEYSAVGTKVRHWTSGDRRYTETSYFNVSRRLHVNYDGIPVDASIAMDDTIMDLMEPYAYEQIQNHDNKFLSGFDSETYNMSPEQLQPRAVQKVNKSNREWIAHHTSGYTTLTQERFNTNNQPTGNKFALLPVWVYEYRYNGENYKFYVNGQTGKCVGKAPLSLGKAVGLTALLFGSMLVSLNGLALLLGVL